MRPLPNLSPFVFQAKKNIQSSPLVLNSGIGITWKLNEEDFWIFPPALCYRIKSWELQLSMCVLSMSMPYMPLQNKRITCGINSVYLSEISLWTVSSSLYLFIFSVLLWPIHLAFAPL